MIASMSGAAGRHRQLATTVGGIQVGWVLVTVAVLTVAVNMAVAGLAGWVWWTSRRARGRPMDAATEAATEERQTW